MSKDSDWRGAVAVLNDMLSKRKYKYCWETCHSMRDWIEKNEHVTEKQLKAIHSMYSFGDSKGVSI